MNIFRLLHKTLALSIAWTFLFTNNIWSASILYKDTLRPPLTLSDKRIAEVFVRYHAIYRNAGGMETEGYPANPGALHAALGEPYKLAMEALGILQKEINKGNVKLRRNGSVIGISGKVIFPDIGIRPSSDIIIVKGQNAREILAHLYKSQNLRTKAAAIGTEFLSLARSELGGAI